MAFTSLLTTQTDAKSPIDDQMMDTIRTDLDDLNSRVIAAGASPFIFELQGKLKYVDVNRSICFGLVNKEFTPSICRWLLKQSGTTDLKFDLRKHTQVKVPIKSINYLYSDATQSVGKTGTSLSTQSISRATSQISTQSITYAKSAKTILSIAGIGNNQWVYMLNSSLDSDSVAGHSISFSGCTNAANDGVFTMDAINQGESNCVVVTNPSGVEQVSSSGSAQVLLMSYNFINPVSSYFVAGDTAIFASHTDGGNNGTFIFSYINLGGNNIIVNNPNGTTQGGVAGTVDCNRFKYNFSSAVSTTDYVVGESILAQSHTSGSNNGSFPIKAVNDSGNNVLIYNSNGAVQGGAAGTVDTDRWTYSLPSDPSSGITSGDSVYVVGHTSSVNDGIFVVKEVNRSASNNIVIYNPSGTTQGGAAGSTNTVKKEVKFFSDQSAFFTTDSYIEMKGVKDDLFNHYPERSPFKVFQVNRGGGANYNVIIESNYAGANYGYDVSAGYVQTEMKSIFTSLPTITKSLSGQIPNQNIVGSTNSISTDVITANTPIMLYITQVPSGEPLDLTVFLL